MGSEVGTRAIVASMRCLSTVSFVVFGCALMGCTDDSHSARTPAGSGGAATLAGASGGSGGPPAEAINSPGLGVAFVAVLPAGLTLTDGKLAANTLKAEDLAGVSSRHGVIWRA